MPFFDLFRRRPRPAALGSFDQSAAVWSPDVRIALDEVFDSVRYEENKDSEQDFDFVISSAGDYGRAACSGVAGALWLADHSLIFVRALRRYAALDSRPHELLEGVAAIARVLAEDVDLPTDDNVVQACARILMHCSSEIALAPASDDLWQGAMSGLADRSAQRPTGTGNELAVLPWALEVERSPQLPSLDARLARLREVTSQPVVTSPISSRELNLWAYFLLLVGRWKAATPMATLAVEMEAAPANLDTLGWAHFFEGNLQRSLDLLSRAMEQYEAAEDPLDEDSFPASDWAESGYHKAYVFVHSGRIEDARVLLSRLNAKAPKSFWTRKANELAPLMARSSENIQRHLKSYEFDVALSFAGEDRRYASELADLLAKAGVSVFYDDFQKADLWGKNLYSHLSDLYLNRARFCVMLISRAYASKPWPGLNVKRRRRAPLWVQASTFCR